MPPDDPEDVTVTPLPGGYSATWAAAAEADYAVTEIHDSDQSVNDITGATLRGEVAGTVFQRLDVDEPTDLKVWVRHKDRAGNVSDPVTAEITTLDAAEGADGEGFENIYRRFNLELGKQICVTGLPAGDHTIEVRAKTGNIVSDASDSITVTIPG